MNTTTINTALFNSLLFPHANNDNMLIYNGELLPEDVKNNVTRSIENLMNRSRTVYTSKIYRSTHCIWYILVKNIPELFILNSLINTFSIAENNIILKNTLVNYPQILFNNNINYNGYPGINLLNNIGTYLSITENIETNDGFDLLE